MHDGDFIESGHAYAEIEVMKMILQLKTTLSGTVTLKVCALCLHPPTPPPVSGCVRGRQGRDALLGRDWAPAEAAADIDHLHSAVRAPVLHVVGDARAFGPHRLAVAPRHNLRGMGGRGRVRRGTRTHVRAASDKGKPSVWHFYGPRGPQTPLRVGPIGAVKQGWSRGSVGTTS